MSLIVGAVLLAFLVHDEDPLFPLVVVLGNSYPNTGDDRGVQLWDSLSHSGDHRSAVIRVIAPSCQFSLLLQLLEEDGSGIAAHLHVLHPLLVFFFDGGIPKHGLEFPYEFVPMWVLESGTSGISVVVDPEVFSSMGPSGLGAFDKEGGGAHYHE